MLRIEFCALVVSDDSVTIVNRLKTHRIARRGGLMFAFGNDLPNTSFWFRDRMHVELRVDAEHNVNVAALTLGNTRLGADRVAQIVDEVNARMRTWDTHDHPEPRLPKPEVAWGSSAVPVGVGMTLVSFEGGPKYSDAEILPLVPNVGDYISADLLNLRGTDAARGQYVVTSVDEARRHSEAKWILDS